MGSKNKSRGKKGPKKQNNASQKAAASPGLDKSGAETTASATPDSKPAAAPGPAKAATNGSTVTASPSESATKDTASDKGSAGAQEHENNEDSRAESSGPGSAGNEEPEQEPAAPSAVAKAAEPEPTVFETEKASAPSAPAATQDIAHAQSDTIEQASSPASSPAHETVSDSPQEPVKKDADEPRALKPALRQVGATESAAPARLALDTQLGSSHERSPSSYSDVSPRSEGHTSHSVHWGSASTRSPSDTDPLDVVESEPEAQPSLEDFEGDEFYSSLKSSVSNHPSIAQNSRFDSPLHAQDELADELSVQTDFDKAFANAEAECFSNDEAENSSVSRDEPRAEPGTPPTVSAATAEANPPSSSPAGEESERSEEAAQPREDSAAFAQPDDLEERDSLDDLFDLNSSPTKTSSAQTNDQLDGAQEASVNVDPAVQSEVSAQVANAVESGDEARPRSSADAQASDSEQSGSAEEAGKDSIHGDVRSESSAGQEPSVVDHNDDEDDDEFYRAINSGSAYEAESSQVSTDKSLTATQHPSDGAEPDSEEKSGSVSGDDDDFYKALGSSEGGAETDTKPEEIESPENHASTEQATSAPPSHQLAALDLDDDDELLDDDDDEDFDIAVPSQAASDAPAQQLSFLESDEELLSDDETPADGAAPATSAPLAEPAVQAVPEPAPAPAPQTLKARSSVAEFRTDQKSFDLPLEMMPQVKPRRHAAQIISRTGTPRSAGSPLMGQANLAPLSPHAAAPAKPPPPPAGRVSRPPRAASSGSKYAPVPGSQNSIVPPPPGVLGPAMASQAMHSQAMPPQGMSPQLMHSQAVFPQAVPPPSLNPQAMPPRASQPQAMPPRAFPQRAMPSRALPPQAMPPQAIPPQAMPPQAMPPQAMPQAMPPPAMPPQAMPHQAMPPQSMPPQGMPPQAMPPQAMPPQAMPPQAMPPHAMPPHAMPPQAMPPQAMPPQAMPPQAMPPQAMPLQNAPRRATPQNAAPPRAHPARTAPPVAVSPQAELSQASHPHVVAPPAVPSQAYASSAQAYPPSQAHMPYGAPPSSTYSTQLERYPELNPEAYDFPDESGPSPKQAGLSGSAGAPPSEQTLHSPAGYSQTSNDDSQYRGEGHPQGAEVAAPGESELSQGSQRTAAQPGPVPAQTPPPAFNLRPSVPQRVSRQASAHVPNSYTPQYSGHQGHSSTGSTGNGSIYDAANAIPSQPPYSDPSALAGSQGSRSASVGDANAQLSVNRQVYTPSPGPMYAGASGAKIISPVADATGTASSRPSAQTSPKSLLKSHDDASQDFSADISPAALSKLPFPLLGPKGPIKGKKKDLEKWIDERVAERSPLPGTLLYKLLRQLASDSSKKKAEICSVLAEHRSNLRFETAAHSSTVSAESPTHIFSALSTGSRKDAFQTALDNRAYSHALLLGRSLGAEDWQLAVEEFVANEVRKTAAPLAFVYRALAAETAEGGVNAIYELKPRGDKSLLDEGKVDGYLVHWAGCAATLYEATQDGSNSPGAKPALIELGKLLVQRGWVEEGHACFILCGVPLGSMAEFQLPLTAEASNPVFDSYVIAEICEFTLGRGSPGLLPHKLSFANLLADAGYSNEGLKIAETVAQVLKSTRNAPPPLVEAANMLVERCSSTATSPSGSGGWLQRKLSRPNLEKAWVSSFNKFVSGEDEVASADAEASTVQNGAAPPQRPLSVGAQGSTAAGQPPANFDFPLPQRQSYTPGPDWGSASTGVSPGLARPQSTLTARPAGFREVEEEYASSERPSLPGQPPSRYEPPRSQSLTNPVSYTPQKAATAPQETAQAARQTDPYAPSQQWTPGPFAPGLDGQPQHRQEHVGPQGRYSPAQPHSGPYTQQGHATEGYPYQQGGSRYAPAPPQATDTYSQPPNMTAQPGMTPAEPSLRQGPQGPTTGASYPPARHEQAPYQAAPPQAYNPYQPSGAAASEFGMQNDEIPGQSANSGPPYAPSNQSYEPAPPSVPTPSNPTESETPANKTAKEEDSKPEQKHADGKDDGKGKRGWFSWLKKEDDKANKPIEVKLGSNTQMYFDKDLGRWVAKGGPKPEPKKGPPPPPKMGGKAPEPQLGANAPVAANSGPGGLPSGPRPASSGPLGAPGAPNGPPGTMPGPANPMGAAPVAPHPALGSRPGSVGPGPAAGGFDGILAAATSASRNTKRRPGRSRYVNTSATGIPEGMQ